MAMILTCFLSKSINETKRAAWFPSFCCKDKIQLMSVKMDGSPHQTRSSELLSSLNQWSLDGAFGSESLIGEDVQESGKKIETVKKEHTRSLGERKDGMFTKIRCKSREEHFKR